MQLSTLRSLGIVTGILVAIGCGSSRSSFDEPEQTAAPPTPKGSSSGGDDTSGGFGGDVSGDVALDPKNVTVIIDSATNPVTPGTVTYKVTSKGSDASATATFTLEDSTLGTFAGSTFTSADALPGDKLG